MDFHFYRLYTQKSKILIHVVVMSTELMWREEGGGRRRRKKIQKQTNETTFNNCIKFVCFTRSQQKNEMK
jgi:hypothetical protein